MGDTIVQYFKLFCNAIYQSGSLENKAIHCSKYMDLIPTMYYKVE